MWLSISSDHATACVTEWCEPTPCVSHLKVFWKNEVNQCPPMAKPSTLKAEGFADTLQYLFPADKEEARLAPGAKKPNNKRKAAECK